MNKIDIFVACDKCGKNVYPKGFNRIYLGVNKLYEAKKIHDNGGKVLCEECLNIEKGEEI